MQTYNPLYSARYPSSLLVRINAFVIKMKARY